MLFRLFITFFKIGLFTFGGGYAMIPLIEREVIAKKTANREIERRMKEKYGDGAVSLKLREQYRNMKEMVYPEHSHLLENAKAAANKLQEQLDSAFAKATDAAKKDRKRKIAREVVDLIVAAAGVAGLYMAQNAGLISPVLTGPLYAIAFVSIGWHLCKFDRLRGRR